MFYLILVLFYRFWLLFPQFRLFPEVLGKSKNPRWRHLAIMTLLSRDKTSSLRFGDLKGNMSLSYLLSLLSYEGGIGICPLLPPPVKKKKKKKKKGKERKPVHDSVKDGWQSKEMKFLNNATFSSQVVVGRILYFAWNLETWIIRIFNSWKL